MERVVGLSCEKKAGAALASSILIFAYYLDIRAVCLTLFIAWGRWMLLKMLYYIAF